jgi:hypothetical protein
MREEGRGKLCNSVSSRHIMKSVSALRKAKASERRGLLPRDIREKGEENEGEHISICEGKPDDT